MKTRKYTYTCEHPGSDVIITSDKPMNKPICPLCATVMVSFYDRLLGVPASGKKDCPRCGSTPLTVFFRGVEGKLLSGRQCMACDYEEFDQEPEKRKDINDLPVEDIDSESAQAGRDVWERVSGAPNIRVPGRFVVTETPHSPDKRLRGQIGSDKQNFSMENTMTKYHCKLISEIDFYFESDEEIKHSYVPADYPEHVKALIDQAALKLGKDRFIVATMEKRRQGTFQNSSED